MNLTSIANNIVKHAVFDAYGTLFDVHSAVSKYQLKLGNKAQEVSSLWRQKQLEYTWLRSIMECYVNFEQVTQEALDFALESTGISDSNLRGDLLNAYQELSCYNEVPDVLRFIKNKGLGMYILSNGTFAMIEAGLKNSNLDDYFDQIFSVDRIRVFKPDPRVYQIAVDQIGCKPEEILFFSSNAWDISGASYFGYQTVWVNRFGQKYERLPGIPFLVINSLDAVLGHFSTD